MKIGILAGTFDPVHVGHLALAEAAMGRFQLDKVLLMPEHHPRGKVDVSPYKHRLAMLKAAVAGNSKFQILDTKEKYFTLPKTMPILGKRFKDAGFMIMVGSDVARTLADWTGIDKLSSNVAFLVGLRTGDSEMSVRDQLSQPAIKPRISYLNSPNSTLAASLIRSGQVETGIAKVDRYIAEHKLYD